VAPPTFPPSFGFWRAPDLRPELFGRGRAIATLLVEALDPLRIVWFGSRAAGSGREDSDVDLLVVVGADLPLGERLARANRATGAVRVPKHILVFTPAEHAK
jgi:predicted nucleotidyltransferase